MAEEVGSEAGDSGSDAARMLSKRERKNAKARERAALTAERVEEIRSKPPKVRTKEEISLLNKYEQRRARRNERSRERANDGRKEIERILAVPAEDRSEEQIDFLSKALDAKKRKNQGDRNRRKMLRSLGVPARIGLKRAADQGLLPTKESGKSWGLKTRTFSDPWAQKSEDSHPSLPSLEGDQGSEGNNSTTTPKLTGTLAGGVVDGAGENWDQPSNRISWQQIPGTQPATPSYIPGNYAYIHHRFPMPAYGFTGRPPALPMRASGITPRGVTPTTHPFPPSPLPFLSHPQARGWPLGMGFFQASPANFAGGDMSEISDTRDTVGVAHASPSQIPSESLPESKLTASEEAGVQDCVTTRKEAKERILSDN